MTLGRVALDSTKVKANASKHKAMSYGRMREKAQQLRAEVKYLLSQAEAADAEDDRRLGSSRRGGDLPAELQRRESRLQRIQAAKRALEARARDEATAAGEAETAVKPADTAQYNFTDPESRIMHHKPDGFVQGYNVQVAVEGTLQLIVGEAVTQDTNDKRQLRPMIRTIQQQARQTPAQLLADSGYCSDESLRDLAGLPIDGYIATRRLKHSERPAPAPRGRIPRDATALERMARKLRTQAGAAIYATRKASWNRCWDRSNRPAAFDSFSCAGSRRSGPSGRSSARRTTS